MADALEKHSELTESEKARAREKNILGQVSAALKQKETIDTLVDEAPTVNKRRFKMLSGPISWGEAEKERKKEAEAEEISGPSGPPDVTEPVAAGAAPPIAPIARPEEGLRRRPRRAKMVSSPAVGGADLWGEDTKVQNAAIAGAPSPPVQYDLQSGMRYGVARRQRMPSDLGAIAENAPTIEERLGGIVRHSIDPSLPGAYGGRYRDPFE